MKEPTDNDWAAANRGALVPSVAVWKSLHGKELTPNEQFFSWGYSYGHDDALAIKQEQAEDDADQALGAAWRRCEELMPQDWDGPILQPVYRREGQIVIVSYRAAVSRFPSPSLIEEGFTATEALESLARRLAQSQ